MTRADGVVVAAVDLGAASGRVVRASFDGERLIAREVSRFTNAPSSVGGVLRWDVDQLWHEVSSGLGAIAGDGTAVASVGVDTWGVDYGLLRADGTLLDRPTCYRDPRQVAPMARALETIGRERLYGATGSQIAEINTLFALMSDVETSTRLEDADQLLMMPDVFHHLLSGSRTTEHTVASTTGMYDTARRCWAVELVEALGVPARVLPELVAPGTDLGPVVGALGSGALAGTRVIAPAGHDTASAVAATPFAEPGDLFLSSGTWSLMGVERPDPVITAASLEANLTNEAGAAGTVRLLRNVMGLWILQECRRQWARDGEDLGHDELARLAAGEAALRSIVNPNALEFLTPGDMPSRVREYCAATGSPVPESIGQVARCVVDSLALVYRATVEDIAAATGTRARAINVTGGGSNHGLLAQATADATGLPVRCGPVEATALGNAGVQLVALGELANLDEIRAVVARTTSLRSYDPAPGGRWDEAAVRLRELTARDDRRRGLTPT